MNNNKSNKGINRFLIFVLITLAILKVIYPSIVGWKTTDNDGIEGLSLLGYGFIIFLGICAIIGIWFYYFMNLSIEMKKNNNENFIIPRIVAIIIISVPIFYYIMLMMSISLH